MKWKKENTIEMLVLASCVVLAAVLSFYKIDKSISVVKYHFQWEIRALLDNYLLFHQSFANFLYQTSAYHTGNSGAEWHTVFYLLPLFSFCDFLGGLSLKTICLFTVTTSLLFLVLFYGWVRKYWGKQQALFAVFFLGVSSIFQEFARSGSFDVYSLLIAIVWVLLIFRLDLTKGILFYFAFGLLTGLTWYGHGLLRGLTLVAIYQILILKDSRKALNLGIFLTGMMGVLIPGYLIKLSIAPINLSQYHHHLYRLIFDKEASFEDWSFSSFVKTVLDNVVILGHRILGGKQLVEDFVIRDRTHACYWSPLLDVPFFVGFGQIFKKREDQTNRTVLLLAAVIYLTPCLLTTTLGFVEARRSMLYIIPSYCFIGIGMNRLMEYIGKIQHNFFKKAAVFLVVAALGAVVISQLIFDKQYVLSSKRDVGFLAFIDKVKTLDHSKKIYYIDGKTAYFWTKESDIMRVALMEKGKSLFEIGSGVIKESAPGMWRDFYVATGSDISLQEFDDWCTRNNLRGSLIFESPVENALYGTKSHYFRFFMAHRIN